MAIKINFQILTYICVSLFSAGFLIAPYVNRENHSLLLIITNTATPVFTGTVTPAATTSLSPGSPSPPTGLFKLVNNNLDKVLIAVITAVLTVAGTLFVVYFQKI